MTILSKEEMIEDGKTIARDRQLWEKGLIDRDSWNTEDEEDE